MLVDFDILTIVIGLLLFTVIASVFKFKLKKDNVYLTFLFIMFVYLLFVAKFTIFPFHIFVSGFDQNIIGNIYLVPFKNGIDYNFLMNILMTIPFGFGFPFLFEKYKKKRIFIIALLPGLIIEILQLILALPSGYIIRTVHIDDVIANYIGTIIGFLLLKSVFSVIYIKIIKSLDIELIKFWDYIYKKCLQIRNMPDVFS